MGPPRTRDRRPRYTADRAHRSPSCGLERDRQTADSRCSEEGPPAIRAGRARVGDALGDQMQSLLDLGAGDILADAQMIAAAEADMLPDLGAIRIEAVGIGHHP